MPATPGRTVAPNPSPTAAPGVAVANGKIYFVGGCADGSCTASNKVEVYDPSSDSWSSAANYPTGTPGRVRRYQRQGVLRRRHQRRHHVNTGNVYDPSSDSWSPIANMPTDLWGRVAGAPDRGARHLAAA